MDRSELGRELERLHAQSWGWTLACCERDRELAEEVLQSVYLRVFSGQARFHGRSSLRTWLFGVIRWSALDEKRRRHAHRSRDADADHARLIADEAPGADVVTEESERSARLVVALDTLSPRQREVLQLVFYHDMTIEDAAAVMKISIGSARTHYDRGKKALARALTRERENAR
jgi:RNA polymerase sigma factor (sigma-70 family)